MRTFGYKENTRDVDDLKEEVETHVSETFGTDIHKYKIALLSNPSMREDYERVYREITGENIPQHYVGHCLYTGCSTLSEDHLKNVDYIVAVKDVNTYNPMILSEELTHGEHFCRHLDSGSNDHFEKYNKKFRGLSIEFIGSLGFYSALKGMEKAGIDIEDCVKEVIKPKIREAYDYLDNHVAHKIVRDFVWEFDDIPYREFFNAKDSENLWGLLSDFVGKNCYEMVDIDGPFSKDVYKTAVAVLVLSPGAPVIIRMEGPSGKRFSFRFNYKDNRMEYSMKY